MTGAKHWIKCIQEPDAVGVRFFAGCVIKSGKSNRKKVNALEWNDIYNVNRQPTGRLHRRGTPWEAGEYGLVVCVWVYDGAGNILLTRRATGKSFSGTWENSGGAAKAGETSLQAINRELYEETGISAKPEEFELIDSGCDRNTHFDYYTLIRNTPLEEIKLLPGETDDAKWVTFAEIHKLIRENRIERIEPQIIGGKSKYLCTYDAAAKQLSDYTLERSDSSFGVRLVITEIIA